MGAPGFANVALSGTTLAATVYVDDRVFEVGLGPSGTHEVRELLPAAVLAYAEEHGLYTGS